MAVVGQNGELARAFTSHLLRFVLARELDPADSMMIDAVVDKTEHEKFKLKSLIKEVVFSVSGSLKTD